MVLEDPLSFICIFMTKLRLQSQVVKLFYIWMYKNKKLIFVLIWIALAENNVLCFQI